MAGRKPKTPKDLIMMKPGLRAQIPGSPSLSLASDSSRRGLHYTNAGYDNPDSIGSGHDYEDLEYYNHASTGPRKQPNTIYESSAPVPQHRHRQFTECSDDSTSSGSEDHYQKGKSRFKEGMFALILFFSLASLVVVILMAVGVIGPKCSLCDDQRVSGPQYLTKIDKPYVRTENVLEKMTAMEKNITSLMVRDTLMLALIRRHEKQISELQTKLANVGDTDKESPSQSHFQQNITNEVQALREKQDDFDTSLENLKSNDKTTNSKLQDMESTVHGLAITINYMTLNDSSIKSKLNNLTRAERRFNSELISLKRKDVEIESSLQSLKSSDSSLNSSVHSLQTLDENLKVKMELMNSTVLSKIKNITDIINGMVQVGGQHGPPGPPGPPGPSGAGNLTQCKHEKRLKSATSGVTADTDVIYPVDKDKVVIGATCSTIGGDETNLRTPAGYNNQGQKVYICNCKGESSFLLSVNKMTCRIDVWVCPRIS